MHRVMIKRGYGVYLVWEAALLPFALDMRNIRARLLAKVHGDFTTRVTWMPCVSFFFIVGRPTSQLSAGGR